MQPLKLENDTSMQEIFTGNIEKEWCNVISDEKPEKAPPLSPLT